MSEIQELAEECIPSPMDRESTNREKGARAAFALAHVEGFYDFEGGTGLGDFLADFMHLCDVLDVVFDAALNNGRMHYDAEKAIEND